MGTTVTRGKGRFVVTATGMDTEIGKIAGMIHSALGDYPTAPARSSATCWSWGVFVGMLCVRGRRFEVFLSTACSLPV